MAARKSTQKKTGPNGENAPRSWLGRLLARLLAPVLIGLVAAVVLGAAVVGLRWVLLVANPFFTLARIEIRTDGKALSEEQILEILADMDCRAGQTNLFAIDVRGIRERLERAAVVESARIYRILPNVLVVDTAQRRPAARLRGRISRFVDGEGHVLLPWEAEGFSLLPEIVGVRGTTALRPGEKTDDELLLGALEFLRLNEEYGEALHCRPHTIQLDYHPPLKLKIYVHREGTFRENAQVLVPLRRMSEALNRLAVIVRDRTGLGLPTGFVDVTYEEHVPVRK